MTDWPARFRHFTERKEREARNARLYPFETVQNLATPDLLRVGNAWSEQLFDGPFYMARLRASDSSGASARQALPAVNLVFVQSRDGNTGAADPSSLGGGATDKHLIYEGLSRVAADAVLAGADTIRGEDVLFSVWREEAQALRAALGKPRHPIQIVATLRGLAFDDTLLYNVPDLRVVVVTVAKCYDTLREGFDARPWITPILMAHKDDLRAAFAKLRQLGVERVTCVGGRTVAASLIDAGLVQDVYLTTSPKAGGQPNTPLYSKPLDRKLVVRKHGTGEDVGVTFEHFTIGA